MTRPAFRASDVARAVKAVQAAGVRVSGVEFTSEGFKVLAEDLPAGGQARDARQLLKERQAGAAWARSR